MHKGKSLKTYVNKHFKTNNLKHICSKLLYMQCNAVADFFIRYFRSFMPEIFKFIINISVSSVGICKINLKI